MFTGNFPRVAAARRMLYAEMDLRLGMPILLIELRVRDGRRTSVIDSAYSLRRTGRYLRSPRGEYFEEFAWDCVE
jgi:hypothetical protein